MHTFIDHVHTVRLLERLQFLETFFPLKPEQYDELFATELRRLAMQVKHPKVRKELEDLERFGFTRYIMASIRNNAGISDPRELDERTHEVVSKLLLGKLFSFDPTGQPFIARFKASVTNAIRNQIAKQRNQRRLIPSIPISDEPGVGIPSSELAGRKLSNSDNGVIDEFSDLVHQRLGPLGSAVLRAKLDGDEVKGLIGSVEYNDPSSYKIKQMVIGIKRLAKEFARQRGDSEFLNQIERMMDAERRTVEKRFGKAGAIVGANMHRLQ